MNIRGYQDLEVWQKAMDLVVVCYQVTAEFPKSEIYGLTSQLKRAVVSVPSNIAEGRGRRQTRAFLHHLAIAYGSLMETETQLQIAERLMYLDKQRLTTLLNKTSEVGRMINGLSQSLRKHLPTES